LKGGALMAEAMGVDTRRTKIVIFLMAALFAALSGWMYAHLQHFLNPTPFGLQIGIEYLFMAVIGDAAHVWGAVIGATVITVLKQWPQDILPQLFGATGNFEVIAFGLLMIFVLHRARDGLWPMFARFATAPESRASHAGFDDAPPLPRRALPPRGTPLLEVSDAVKKFGGLIANDRMSLSVAAGEILALIGPNGAGKTALLSTIIGVLPFQRGEIASSPESRCAASARSSAWSRAE
jgi:branched-chain amino acid transport system permease protein